MANEERDIGYEKPEIWWKMPKDAENQWVAALGVNGGLNEKIRCPEDDSPPI
jgi:hypothetical protein